MELVVSEVLLIVLNFQLDIHDGMSTQTLLEKRLCAVSHDKVICGWSTDLEHFLCGKI